MGSVRIVVQRMGEADGQLSLIALWTQAQVDAEDRTFRGGTGQNLGHRLRQPYKVFAIRDGSAGGLATVAIEKQQIDIGTVVKLIPSKFSQREHGEGGLNETTFSIRVLGQAVLM